MRAALHNNVPLLVGVMFSLSCGATTQPAEPPAREFDQPAPTGVNGGRSERALASGGGASQRDAVVAGTSPRDSTAPPPPDPNLHRPIRPTTYVAELAALGCDPSQLPTIGSLSASQKLDVMELIVKSLGVECTHCHVSANDYQSETRQKRVARQMWDRMTVGHQLAGGSVFCDSCHQGSAKLLQRARKNDVKAYMRREYGQLLDANRQPAKCEDCHGSPFQPNLFEQVWGVDAAPSTATSKLEGAE